MERERDDSSERECKLQTPVGSGKDQGEENFFVLLHAIYCQLYGVRVVSSPYYHLDFLATPASLQRTRKPRFAVRQATMPNPNQTKGSFLTIC